MELVDMAALKAAGGNAMRVQIPPTSTVRFLFMYRNMTVISSG